MKHFVKSIIFDYLGPAPLVMVIDFDTVSVIVNTFRFVIS